MGDVSATHGYFCVGEIFQKSLRSLEQLYSQERVWSCSVAGSDKKNDACCGWKDPMSLAEEVYSSSSLDKHQQNTIINI